MAEATLLLINSTIYNFSLINQHQYQMEDWHFPPLVGPGQKALIPISFHHGAYSMDDGAEANYCLDGGSSSFSIQARAPDRNFQIYLDATGLQNDGHPHPRELLGWTVDKQLVIWISGTSSGYLTRYFWH